MKRTIFLPVNLWIFVANLFVVIGATVLLLLNQKTLPPQIPLWFSKPWGEARLAEPKFIWLLAFIILLVFFINNILAKLLLDKHRTLALIMVWAALIISLILLFPLYRILLVVI